MWIKICNFEELVRVLNEKNMCAIYCVVTLALVLSPRNQCQIQYHEALPIYFFLRILALTFNYLTHFELIFVYKLRV